MIAIHLESLLLMISSNLPRWLIKTNLLILSSHLYMVLLLMGFTLPNMLPYLRWALTSPFQPYHLLAVFFLLHFPLGYYPSRGLPGIIILWSPDFPLKFQRLSNNLPYKWTIIHWFCQLLINIIFSKLTNFLNFLFLQMRSL